MTPAPDAQPWSRDELVRRLRAVGEARYHIHHPFNQRMHRGELRREELQLWVANRFCYQQAIPIKDAAIMSNCPEPEVRRRWIQRIVDHDGRADGEGGLEAWLRLAEALGVERDTLLAGRGVLPGGGFAVEAYITVCLHRPWIDAVAAAVRVAAKARLQWDEVRQRHVLLYPEGLVALNETGADILALCDGTRTVAGIVTSLQQRYGVEGVQQDVTGFLEALAAKGLILFEGG